MDVSVLDPLCLARGFCILLGLGSCVPHLNPSGCRGAALVPAQQLHGGCCVGLRAPDPCFSCHWSTRKNKQHLFVFLWGVGAGSL